MKEYIKSVVYHKYRTKAPNNDQLQADFKPNFDKLKYALRSIEKFAPWIRKIWIVGEKPSWISTENSNITVVPHEEFMFWDDLPTFNHHALENSLHKISGLSENFIYLDDSFIFANQTCPSHFITKKEGYKFFIEGVEELGLEDSCPSSCLEDSFSDDRCDEVCNTVSGSNKRPLFASPETSRPLKVPYFTTIKPNAYMMVVTALS